MQWHLLLVASLVAGSKEVEVDCVRISVFLVWVIVCARDESVGGW